MWEVHPRDIVGERRRAEERRVTPVEALIDPPVLERRRSDRRTTPTRERVTLLPSPWQDGWIVFEQTDGGSREARRLAPIPSHWTECSEAELARLLSDATTARGHGSVS